MNSYEQSSGRDLAVRGEALGKWYWLGADQSWGKTLLSEKLSSALRSPIRRLRGRRHQGTEPLGRGGFWALRDVSFEVGRGEVVGFIGRNGAGKSTLLKLISRITYPNEGTLSIDGRVGSLLEVGTGFHPELSGRENVFLNGSILGMRRREIEAKFDEIVEFSGVSAFLDTPVKRYSSGMLVRLAFAVAAHLEPEILIIDEVLAVGDAEFQRKCLGKMSDISSSGRTVLFVSHNLPAVKRLCDRAYLLDSGRVAAEGQTDAVVNAYLKDAHPGQRGGVAFIGEQVERVGTGDARLTQVSLHDSRGKPADRLSLATGFQVRMAFEVRKPIDGAVLELGVSTIENARVLTVQNIDGGKSPLTWEPGGYEVTATVDTALLPGEYTLDIGLHLTDGLTLDQVIGALSFAAENFSEKANDHWPWSQVRGFVRSPSEWSVVQLEEQMRPVISSREHLA